MKGKRGFQKGEKFNLKHGFKHSRFYRIYYGIHNRCNNPKQINFCDYGKRGIKLLWSSFEEFRDDMYESYQIHTQEFGDKDTMIERINSDGNYCKKNCRWATRKEQNNNTKNTILLSFNGETLSLPIMAERHGLKKGTLWRRIKIQKWSIEKSLTKPLMVNQFI